VILRIQLKEYLMGDLVIVGLIIGYLLWNIILLLELVVIIVLKYMLQEVDFCSSIFLTPPLLLMEMEIPYTSLQPPVTVTE